MGGPWEEYQDQGPWTEYAKPATRSVAGGFAEGATDILAGLAQIGIKGREALGIPSSVSSEQAKNILKSREQSIAQSRGPDAGFDLPRTVGQMAASLPIALLPGGLVTQGAIAGAAQPVTGDNFLEEKAAQVGLGAGGALLGGAAARGVGKAIGGIRGAKNVVALAREGITPTPGQTVGGIPANLEERAASLPFAGQPIRAAQQRSTEQLNVAAYNRALSPIGEKITPGKIGGDAVAEVESKLSGAYQKLLPKLKFAPDAQFTQDVSDITARAAADLPETEAKRAGDLISRLSKGEFKEAEKRLGYWARKYGSSSNPEQQALGDYLDEALDAFRGGLVRSNPAEAEELKAINAGWANYARVRDAASRVGAEENVFTAAQLQSAVRSGDKSVGKGAFAKGQALMQDLSQPAKQVLGRRLPTSGTPERMALMEPVKLALGASAYPLTRAIYSPRGQAIVNALLANRAPVMQQLGAGVRQLGGPAGIANAQLANELLRQ